MKNNHSTFRTSAPGPRGWRARIPRLSQFAVEHLLVLPVGALIALVWANTRPESYYQFAFSSSFIVNDIGMVFFFALIIKEVVEATALHGVLHSWRRAALPVIASVGGAVVSAVIYVVFVRAVDEAMLSQGWPVPMAIDLALTYFFARIIFRPHAVIPFLLLLGIAADALGFVALALFYPTRELHLVGAAVLMAAAIGLAYSLRRARVRSFWPYILVGGGLSWYALFWGGLHPALALVPIMPFLPHAARDPGFFVDALPGARDALSRFELTWRYPVQVALFFFGLVNAGVSFQGLEHGTWGVPVATLAGKPLGILAGAGLAVAAGLHLPPRVGWRELIVVGFVGAIGFTVALFFAATVMAPGQLLRETKMGVLLSLSGAPLAILAARLLRVGRFAR